MGRRFPLCAGNCGASGAEITGENFKWGFLFCIFMYIISIRQKRAFGPFRQEDIRMTRSNAREIAVHLIFALGFGSQSDQELLDSELTRERFQELAEDMPLYAQYPNEKQEQYIRKLVSGVFFHGPELDDYISRYAVGWSFARIPRMAAAIMRTAMYEMLYMPDIPNAAAINEAVELTKRYESPEVVSFVNGILGSFVRAECGDDSPKPDKGESEETDEAPEA